ncbi:MAG: SCP2 sterol-binding domain-containing protein [Conexivisphaera sp.]
MVDPGRDNLHRSDAQDQHEQGGQEGAPQEARVGLRPRAEPFLDGLADELSMSSRDLLQEILNRARNMPEVLQEFKRLSGKKFQFSTNEGDSFVLSVGPDGSPSLESGTAQSPSATIRASDSALSDILAGRADAIQSFFTGKVKVSGDIISAQGLVNILKKLR